MPYQTLTVGGKKLKQHDEQDADGTGEEEENHGPLPSQVGRAQPQQDVRRHLQQSTQEDEHVRIGTTAGRKKKKKK